MPATRLAGAAGALDAAGASLSPGACAGGCADADPQARAATAKHIDRRGTLMLMRETPRSDTERLGVFRDRPRLDGRTARRGCDAVFLERHLAIVFAQEVQKPAVVGLVHVEQLGDDPIAA